ncbi:MAG TPA: SpoIIE family protein phosphatase, partial [Candidatus Baltobacteraceae bacterium]|nr:SpoIIE family protein phosphatase [Candidatus Baltobacteraceae bacterium]
ADRVVNLQNNGTFATANIAVLDTGARRLSCVAAGHPGPLCWYESSRIVTDPFIDRGLPLGYRDMASTHNETQTIDLEDCTFVVFFTDGLVEAERDYVGGEARLTQAIAQRSIREAKRPARAIRLAVAPERHPDDLAIMTLSVKAN